jgi:hypothetical protein
MSSRYEVLYDCFQQYAKIKALSEIVKDYYDENELLKFGVLLNMLEDINVRFFHLHSEKLKLEESMKNVTIHDAKDLETSMLRKSEIETELKELSKYPEHYPFTLGQTLELIDFFKKCLDNL